MRILGTLLVGLLIGCLVIAGLFAFKTAVWAKAEQWSRQDPPPPFTPARRALVPAGTFVAKYWLVSSPLILLFFVSVAGFVALRRETTR